MSAPTLTRANGVTHPAPPPYLEVSLRGPVSPWPRTVVPVPPAGARLLPLVATPSGDTATADRADITAAVVPEERLVRSLLGALSRLRAPSADTVIAWSMAATVALVAVDAAIVSYSHIYGLATGHWSSGAETGVQARLLPLSIDGVIVEASLVKLYRARHEVVRHVKRWWKLSLATFMLWLGIVATVAANVTHGLPSSLLPPVAHTVILATLSAWPAGALIGSVEMAMGLVRDKRAVEEGDTDSETDDDSDGYGNRDDAPPPPLPPPTPPPNQRPRRPRRQSHDTVADTIGLHPGWDNNKIALHCGVSVRTVERRRAAGKAAP